MGLKDGDAGAPEVRADVKRRLPGDGKHKSRRADNVDRPTFVWAANVLVCAIYFKADDEVLALRGLGCQHGAVAGFLFAQKTKRKRMRLNFVHPWAIAVYVWLLVAFLCFISTRATADFYPTRATQFCITQAKQAQYGAKHSNPVLQLCRVVSALTYLNAARTLAPDTGTILNATKTDAVELQAALKQSTAPLLRALKLSQDQFRSVIA